VEGLAAEVRHVDAIRLPITVVVLTLVALFAPVAGAGETQKKLTLNDLVEKAKELDGTDVSASGEVIGDVMFRGDHGWVNISDGTNALGVWAPAELLGRIQNAGRYGLNGDLVRVAGTFYRMDPQNGGDIDIHARTLEVIETGGPVPHPVSAVRLVWAAAAGTLGALTGGLSWRRMRSPQASR
jgi:hypothetical protein